MGTVTHRINREIKFGLPPNPARFGKMTSSSRPVVAALDSASDSPPILSHV